MTPTREQVIEWAREADLLDARDDESTVPGCYGAGLERFATLAMAAGQEQGLREAAAKVRTILTDCEARDVDDPELEQVAAAIEQLRSD